MTLRHLLIVTLALTTLGTGVAMAAAPPAAFSASYAVSQGGQPLGTAQVRLQPAASGQWTFSREIKGTGGMAALLGASVNERSTLRWTHGHPETINYDYALQAAIKNKQRHLRVDWANDQVQVEDGKRVTRYAAQPGLVERNTLPLALGLLLRAGQSDMTLPVAVRQTVELQHFKVVGKETLTVPAGRFATVRVERTDADRGFTAWYAPERYLLPVKLAQHDGGDMQLELASYQTP